MIIYSLLLVDSDKISIYLGVMTICSIGCGCMAVGLNSGAVGVVGVARIDDGGKSSGILILKEKKTI